MWTLQAECPQTSENTSHAAGHEMIQRSLPRMQWNPGTVSSQVLSPTIPPAVCRLRIRALPMSVGNPRVLNENSAEVLVWGSALNYLLDIIL